LTRHERQIFLLGYRIGANLTAQRIADNMASLHDDLLAKAKALTENARKAAARQTEMQQSYTDISRELDAANQLLEDMLKDDASQGSSTGGDEPSRSIDPGSSRDVAEVQKQQAQREAQQPVPHTQGAVPNLREKDGGQWSAR
jgi:hypothetical protein